MEMSLETKPEKIQLAISFHLVLVSFAVNRNESKPFAQNRVLRGGERKIIRDCDDCTFMLYRCLINGAVGGMRLLKKSSRFCVFNSFNLMIKLSSFLILKYSLDGIGLLCIASEGDCKLGT